MKTSTSFEGRTEHHHFFCRLWWTRFEWRAEGGGGSSTVRARRDTRHAWVRSKLALVTDDVEGAIAAIGRPPWLEGAKCGAGWSSCGDIGLLAFGNRPMAVDIEAVRSVPRGMGHRYGIDPDRFWQGWTSKEAGLKLLGSGLRIDPARLAFLDDGSIAVDGRRRPVRVEEIGAPPGYVAALAYAADRGIGNAGAR